MNEVDKIFERTENAGGFATGYLEYLSRVFSNINAQDIAKFADLLLDARESGHHIIFMGNGSNATTSSHFANDDGYDKVFLQQLQLLMCQGDVVVAISAPGNSPNVIRAIDYANRNGGVTEFITAFSGGKLIETANHSIHVPTNPKEFGPVEDAHMVPDHLVSAYLMRTIKE